MHCTRGGVSLQLRLRAYWKLVLSAVIFVISPAFCQNFPAAPIGPAEPKFETAQQTNDRISKLALATAVKPREYVIGAGDLLGIEVFDVKEMSRDVRVNESGFIALPLLPVRVQAAGLTTLQFENKVAELLQANGLVSNPQVSVGVKEQHSAPITITGAVGRPVTIQATPQTSLLEALSEAGGISNEAGSKVIITRTAPVPLVAPGSDALQKDDTSTLENSITIDINNLIDSGDLQYNIPLIGGDVVTVPHAGVVYAVGAVQRGGGFVMQSDRQAMSVLKVLSLSGGLISTAKPRNAVVLRQNTASGERQQIPVDLNKILALKAEDVPLRQGDILFVPDSTGKHALRKTGEIALSLATGAAIIRVAR
jgi:polysaccharide export outer membrane protein